MFSRLFSLRRPALALAISCISIGSAFAFPVGAETAAQPVFLGQLLTRSETSTLSWGRDGGFSVPLPNGKDWWVFGDTPRYELQNGAWRLTKFIEGSTAAQRAYTPGKPSTARLNEVNVGRANKSTNGPGRFMTAPKVYLPDGSGKVCDKTNGGRTSEAVRWPTGAALMPDKVNILVTYVDVCVLSYSAYGPQGWGFAIFNSKTNKFTQLPYDVVRPSTNGAPIPTVQQFGSPIIRNSVVTLFSWKCCAAGSGVFTTTVPATVAGLKNPASYDPQLLSGVPATYNLQVAQPSKTHPRLTMYLLRDLKGAYEIYSAPKLAGPWTLSGSGTLPRCDTSAASCTSYAIHPEISPSQRLIVSYFLPGYPAKSLAHVVTASIPCDC